MANVRDDAREAFVHDLQGLHQDTGSILAFDFDGGGQVAFCNASVQRGAIPSSKQSSSLTIFTP
ncbi:MAG TPA: hypothetical protein VEC35_10910 [Noviherbaspirillum sp.]|nr:hypothetical protein [Noviherbaspirillum sp.]